MVSVKVRNNKALYNIVKQILKPEGNTPEGLMNKNKHLTYGILKTTTMSLIGNGSNKEKKKGKQFSNNNKAGFLAPKGSTNSKSAQKNTKLTGGSQRGS